MKIFKIKTMKNNNILLAVGLCASLTMNSQDYHFSQFNENPSIVNPALTGVSHAFRASAVYKEQWRTVATPYTTYGISIESKIKPGNWASASPKQSMTFKKSANRMAAGLSVYNDKAGDAKMGTLQANLSFAMSFPLSKLSALSLGLQGSLVQRKVDQSKLIYANQYNGTRYDTGLPTGELNTQQNFSYGEFGAGAVWSYGHNEKSIGANNDFKALIGFSTYHLNQPKQNYMGTEANEKLGRKYVFHGNVTIGVPNSNIAFVPSWLMQFQGKQKEMIEGVMIKYYMNDDSKYTGIKKRSAIGLGVYYRNFDAIIASFLLDKGQYAVGVSYDINASGLTNVSKSRGGIEINLRFVTPNPFLYQKRSKAMFN